MTNSKDRISVFKLDDPAEKQRWDNQQIARQASFLQSSQWGHFQQSLGQTCHLIAGQSWSCLLIERKTRLGRYLLAPYGPTIDQLKAAPLALKTIKNYARQYGADWLRLEPRLSADSPPLPGSYLAACGGHPAHHNVEPATTRILDLEPDADELLSTLSATTRTFIRKNQRENLVSFKTSTSPQDVPLFVEMLDSVANRKGIGFFSQNYFVKQAEILMPAGMMFLELAYDESQPVGGIIMHDFGQTTSYTYAASLPVARNKNVSALLLWQAMLNAKARGMQKLDLYGALPDDAPPNHPWYGFSSFKRKFGGRLVEHAGTWDIPLSGKYQAYNLAQTIRSLAKRRHH